MKITFAKSKNGKIKFKNIPKDLPPGEYECRYEEILEEPDERLNLCYKHRQEANHSHFAEHNCDYCKLLSTLETLRALNNV